MTDSRDRVPAVLWSQVVILLIAAAAGMWFIVAAHSRDGWAQDWRISLGVGLFTIAVAFGVVDIAEGLVRSRSYALRLGLGTLLGGVAILVGSGESGTAPPFLRWSLTDFQQNVTTEVGAGLVMLTLFDIAASRWLKTREQLDELYVESTKAAIRGHLALTGLSLAEKQLVMEQLGDLRRLNLKDPRLVDSVREDIEKVRPEEVEALALDRMIAVESREYTIKARAAAAVNLVTSIYDLDSRQRAEAFFFAASLHGELEVMPWDVEAQVADFARLLKSGKLRLSQ